MGKICSAAQIEGGCRGDEIPFSPELLDALPEELAELFRGLELKLLQEIVDRLKIRENLNQVTAADIRALRSHGIGIDEIKRAIVEATDIGGEKLDALLDDVVARNQAYYTEMVTLAKVTVPDRLIDERDVAAIRRQTWAAYKNITGSMGFLTRQGGRLVVTEPAKAYQRILDSALLQVESGAISYNQAISEAVRTLADGGLKAAEYEKKEGSRKAHVDSIDVAVRRAVMTGVNQLNQKYREQSMDYLETDLVEVNAHIGARDIGDVPINHKAWQGKVYRWGTKPRTSTGDYRSFEAVCGYGLGEGIGGWNCRHSFWPFIEGASERTYTDEYLAHIDDGHDCDFEGRHYSAYEATQKQREIERSYRKQKRRKVAALNEQDARAANIRMRRLGAEYKAFSKVAGLPEQRERMKVLYA